MHTALPSVIRLLNGKPLPFNFPNQLGDFSMF
jgi:hypothetical protein